MTNRWDDPHHEREKGWHNQDVEPISNQASPMFHEWVPFAQCPDFFHATSTEPTLHGKNNISKEQLFSNGIAGQ